MTPKQLINGNFGIQLPSNYALLGSPDETSKLKDILNELGLLEGRSQYDAAEIVNSLPRECEATDCLFLAVPKEVLQKHFNGYKKEVRVKITDTITALEYEQCKF